MKKTKTAFVEKARNVFGALKAPERARLEAVLANPTQETWENAYSLIVGANGWTTLWQAWLAVDANAPRGKPLDGPWPRIPDQLTLYRALQEVTARITRGQRDYERSLANEPNYHDGTRRKRWDELGEVERWSWERDPQTKERP